MCYYAPVIALTRSHTRTGLAKRFSPAANTVSFVCCLWSLKMDVGAASGGSCGDCDITIRRKCKHCHHVFNCKI